MRFLPLVPSTHPSTWAAEPDEAGGEELADKIRQRDSCTCRFCGHYAQSFQSVIVQDGDIDNATPDNLATACVLCESVQRLGRHRIDDELRVIWLPELSQAALNCVVRRIHVTLHIHGEPAFLQDFPRSHAPAVTAALRAYRALNAEAHEAERRIETRSARDLGAALLAFGTGSRKDLARTMGGVRFLHLGRFYRQGRDIYPDILSAWAVAGATGASAHP